MTIHLTTVWNYESHRMDALCPIKHFQSLQSVTPTPRGHMITIWVLGSLFALTTGCQAVDIDICSILCWFPQKVNGEASREGSKVLPPAVKMRFPHPHTCRHPFQSKRSSLLRGGELLWRAAEMGIRSELYSCSSLEEFLSMHGSP